MKKLSGLRIIAVLFIAIAFSSFSVVKAKEKTETKNPSDLSDYQPDESVYDEITREIKLDNALFSARKVEGLEISITDIFSSVKSGNIDDVKNTVLSSIKKIFVKEILEDKEMLLMVLLISLIGSIFVKLSGNFGNGFVSEQGFYVSYMLITSLLLSAFIVSMEVVRKALKHIINFVKIIVPVYGLAMNFVGSRHMAIGLYELVILGIWLVEIAISTIILPMIKFYVVVSLLNNVNKEDNFSKLCKLIGKTVSWMLKSIVVFIIGISFIKNLLEQQNDILGKYSLNKIISMIPGGGMSAVITGTFFKAGIVIKNSVGITGIIVIVIIVITPVIKTLVIMLMIKLVAAVLQPIGEKRYVNGIDAIAKGIGLLLQVVGSSAALFMLIIAIMAFGTASWTGY